MKIESVPTATGDEAEAGKPAGGGGAGLAIGATDSEAMLGQLLDAIPGFVLLVDQDVSILKHNSAAAVLLGAGHRDVLRQRGGDVLHCVRITNVGDGCGRGEFCKTCLIRTAVSKALAGTKCVRRRFRMELQSGATTTELYVLLSASALVYQGKKAVLLILEDVAELMELQNLLPICIKCKRVRDARMSWNAVDAYLKRHMDLLLTNSYCPECLAQQTELAELQQRAATLTPREYEVFCLVTKGRLNKQIAAVLGTAEKTIKIHRSRVMAKMRVQSAAELVHLADRLGLLSRRRPDGERQPHPAAAPHGAAHPVSATPSQGERQRLRILPDPSAAGTALARIRPLGGVHGGGGKPPLPKPT